jgi:hypothetical protein
LTGMHLQSSLPGGAKHSLQFVQQSSDTKIC